MNLRMMHVLRMTVLYSLSCCHLNSDALVLLTDVVCAGPIKCTPTEEQHLDCQNDGTCVISMVNSHRRPFCRYITLTAFCHMIHIFRFLHSVARFSQLTQYIFSCRVQQTYFHLFLWVLEKHKYLLLVNMNS